MHRHPCGTCLQAGAASRAPGDKPNPVLTILLGLAVMAAFAVALLALTALANPALANPDLADAPSAARRHELVRFVRLECGFCHGLKLTGGLGSPLTAQALADKPRAALEATILYGRTGTAMPGWAPHLSEADAAWIVAALLEGFPE